MQSQVQPVMFKDSPMQLKEQSQYDVKRLQIGRMDVRGDSQYQL